MTPNEHNAWLLQNLKDGANLTQFGPGGTRIVVDDEKFNHLQACETTWAQEDSVQPDPDWIDIELGCACKRPRFQKSVSMRRPNSWYSF